MRDGPNIANIAALIGDQARAEVLNVLMSGMALTATELADAAGVTRQTISTHLAKLREAGLLAVEAQGRHRYFRIADPDVAQLLESLMGVAFGTGAVRTRSSPREPALRKARVCYDHLAGELGVVVYDSLARRGAFALDAGGVALTGPGRHARHRSAAGRHAPPPVPHVPGLERAPPSPGRRARDRVAGTLPATGLGAPRAGVARARVQRERRSGAAGLAGLNRFTSRARVPPGARPAPGYAPAAAA